MLSIGTWCIDTGVTNHICNSLQGFHQTRQLSDGEIYIFLGDGTRISAVAVGDVNISFGRDRILVLKDSLYIHSIKRNLISVSRLVDNGYSFILDRKSTRLNSSHSGESRMPSSA